MNGAYEIFRGNTSLVTSAALTGSADNGYQQGTYGVTVEVYHPPVTGYYVGVAILARPGHGRRRHEGGVATKQLVAALQGLAPGPSCPRPSGRRRQ